MSFMSPIDPAQTILIVDDNPVNLAVVVDHLEEHDERYARAEEYCDVAYKLWEGSWEDDALKVDRATGLFSDPAKVHKIDHRGERYRVEGPHLPSPSPQRSPLLFQAGSSPAGREFAARHAPLPIRSWQAR